MFLLLNDPILFFECLDIVLALTPPGKVVKFTKLYTLFNGFNDSIKEQINVGGKVDIGFDNKGVTASA